MTVYVGDKQKGAVKIEKKNGEYKVYPLKTVYYEEVGTGLDSHKECAFEWSDTPSESWGYKPYEEEDVTKNPETLFDYIKTWANHKVSYTDRIEKKKKQLEEEVL